MLVLQVGIIPGPDEKTIGALIQDASADSSGMEYAELRYRFPFHLTTRTRTTEFASRESKRNGPLPPLWTFGVLRRGTVQSKCYLTGT